jgi:hypothetical protein
MVDEVDLSQPRVKERERENERREKEVGEQL